MFSFFGGMVNSMDSSIIKDYAREHYEEIVALIKDLCAIPAPSGSELARAEFCRDWLESIGAYAYIDSAYNCICPINAEGKDKLTVFVAHTDTVFPDTEPMPYSDDGQTLRAPGVGDDTASLAVMLLTVKFFVEKGLSLPRGVLFVANSGEEGLGNLKGTRQLFEDYKGRISEFISFDSAINKIANECVGSHRYNVKVKTEGGHSYLKFGNRSSIDILAEIISEIYSITPPVIDGVSATYNVGTISGGTSVNTIAENAEMLCEYRSQSAECLRIMSERFKEIFEKPRREGSVTVELVGNRPCREGVDESELNSLIEKCKNVVESVIGTEVTLGSSSTDCNIPLSLGIPAVSVGVYKGGGTHTRAEWVERASLIPGLEICINTVLTLTKE